MCLSIELDRPEDVLVRGEAHGFQYRVTTNGIGFACGYVRLPAGHPWHGLTWEDEDLDASCHGGITFNEPDVPCEKPGPDDAYWIGFDCAHAGDGPYFMEDLDPLGRMLTSILEGSHDVTKVWSPEMVEQECIDLCRQAQAAQAIPLPGKVSL